MPTDFLTDAERERLSSYPEEISSGDLGRFFTFFAEDIELLPKGLFTRLIGPAHETENRTLSLFGYERMIRCRVEVYSKWTSSQGLHRCQNRVPFGIF